MADDTRPSIPTELHKRYDTMPTPMTKDVSNTLGNPHQSPAAGVASKTANANGQEFQSPNGFMMKSIIGETQLKDAQGTVSKQLSRYVRGLDNRRYSFARVVWTP